MTTPNLNMSSVNELERFRELINSTHPIVCVAGCNFEPADVLESMDPQAFNLLFNEFRFELAMGPDFL